MPALTHGRVINGFNSQPRLTKFYKRNCDPVCQKDKVCSVPLQPLNMNPTSGLLKRVNSKPSSDKHASTVAIGRTFAAKRAISRRVCSSKFKLL